MKHFCSSFMRIRERSGFKTAYSFYHSNGGRRAFPFTYAHYLNIERGKTLPQPAALVPMLKCLRIGQSVEQIQDLVRDYLRDLSGDDAVYDYLFAARSPAEDLPAKEYEAGDILGRLSVHITPIQFQSIVASPAATGCFMILSDVPGALTPGQLADKIGISKEKCSAALKDLQRRKVVRAIGNESYSSPLSGRNYTLPGPGFEPLLRKMNKHLDFLASLRNETIVNSGAILRLQSSGLSAVVSALKNALDMSVGRAQSLRSPGNETALYHVETRVRRIAAL